MRVKSNIKECKDFMHNLQASRHSSEAAKQPWQTTEMLCLAPTLTTEAFETCTAQQLTLNPGGGGRDASPYARFPSCDNLAATKQSFFSKVKRKRVSPLFSTHGVGLIEGECLLKGANGAALMLCFTSSACESSVQNCADY